MAKPTQSAKLEVRKMEVIRSLAAVRQRILQVAGSLPPKARGTVFLGTWSARDLLAHLAGWDHANMDAARELMAGRLPDFYSHHDRDWQTYNALLVARHGKANFDELLDDVAASHHQLLECLEAIPAREYDRDRAIRFRGWKVTLGRLMRVECEDEAKHLEQLKEYAAQVQGRRTRKVS